MVVWGGFVFMPTFSSVATEHRHNRDRDYEIVKHVQG